MIGARGAAAARIAVGVAIVALAPALSSARPRPHAGLTVLLTPHTRDGVVTAIGVKEIIGAPRVASGQILLRMPIIAVAVPGALSDPKTLRAADAAGPIPLKIENDPPDPSNFRQDRRWRALRATVGDVTVSYDATPRTITPKTRPGPLYDVRTERQGVYGSFRTLLALPDTGWPKQVKVAWDLTDMAARSRAATSLEGSATARLTRERTAAVLFMAGPLYSLPADGRGRFVVYWLTQPRWDLPGAAAWTRKAYEYYARFWGYPGAPFRVFMRRTDRFQGGGSGGYQSFIFGTVKGEVRDSREVRELMAHETQHNFISGLKGGDIGGQWYSEGADVYYTAVLTYRAGLMSLQRYAEVMNKLAREYYTNPLSHASNDEVTRRFFASHDAEVVPYQRGPLYFAAVDAHLRAASGGRRRVDDLVRAMVRASRDGAGATSELWVSLLRRNLGQAGVDAFEAMMTGKPLDLPSNLLGPCFRREPTAYRGYRPGFQTSQQGGVRTVSSVEPGSAAATAGVRVGDELLDPAPSPDGQASQPAPVTLHLKRDGRPITAVFSPWGPAIPGYRWARTQVPERDCEI